MFQQNIIILFVLTLISSWLCSFARGMYSKQTRQTSYSLWYFNFYQNLYSLIAIILIFYSSDMPVVFSLFSIMLGAAMGVATIIVSGASLKANSLGPFSYTSVIFALSAVIPTLSGLFFGEPVSVLQYIGIALMVICIFLSTEHEKDGEQKRASLLWLAFALLASLASGFVGVAQKVHQMSPLHQDEMIALLLSCFLVSTGCSGIKYLRERNRAKKENGDSISKKQRILTLICGISYAFPNTINLFLAGRVSAVILFPIVNLIPMIALTLSGVAVFQEKLSLKRWVGIGIGIGSAILVSGIIH